MTSTIAIIVAIGAILMWGVGVYNGLIRKRVGCENAWSQIDIQLKRRHDLIPNLVETVKGYATHEQDTLEKVIQARNGAVSAQGGDDVGAIAAAENMLTGTLRQLFAVSEAYPELQANEGFLNLQEELTSTENRIAFSRQHYNDATAVFNTAIQQVPANIVAGIGGFSARDFFELDDAEAAAVKKAPQVSFS
jgi:LemA protein